MSNSIRQWQRELVVLGLLVLAFLWGARLSPYFLDARYLFDASSLYMEAGLLALPMTLLIIAGKIDLSVASTLALTACVSAFLHDRSGLPMPLSIPVALMLGLLLGLFNGLVIVKLRLPPLTVTLGTFALYRGLAQALLKDQSIFRFPEWFGGIDTVRVAGLVPAPLLSVLALAAAHAFALHKTSFGRWTYSIGASQAASRLSGVPVGRAVILLFGWTGLMAALAGQMMTSRLGVARFDMGLGLELDAITAVVLGGTDIFGGRGRIAGTVLAVLLVGVLRTGMGLANWKAEEQLVVIGSLLVLSVALPNVSERWRGARAA